MRVTEKFWSLVDKKADDECWEWQGRRNRKNYGEFYWTKNRYAETLAHRFAYVQANPPRIPEGKVIRHLCDNPSCCNPNHLIIGTDADNARDKVERDRQAKGSKHGNAKLTENGVRAIREDSRPYREIAQQYGVNPNRIGEIKRRRSWVHVI